MKTHVDEVAIQEGVYKHDQDLTYTIPVPVDVHEAVLMSVLLEPEISRTGTYTMLGGGVRCEGMKMQNTAILIIEMTTAVPIFKRCAVALRSEMIEIRLMMICMRN